MRMLDGGIFCKKGPGKMWSIVWTLVVFFAPLVLVPESRQVLDAKLPSHGLSSADRRRAMTVAEAAHTEMHHAMPCPDATTTTQDDLQYCYHRRRAQCAPAVATAPDKRDGEPIVSFSR